MSTTEIATRQNMGDKLDYARTLAESGLLPQAYRKQPANVLYAVEYGESLGLAPMAAITGVHVIEGKPTASAGLISALIRKAGHRLRSGYDAKTGTGWCSIWRADDPEFEFRSEWDLERARAAELTGKKVWKQYPAAMLKARAVTECARDACEEVLFGLHYTPEELGREVDGNGDPVTATAERVQPAPEPERIDWEAKIAAASTAADMREVYTLARGMEPNNAELLERIAALGARLAADENEAEAQGEEVPATADEAAAEEPAEAAEAADATEPIDAEIVDEGGQQA